MCPRNVGIRGQLPGVLECNAETWGCTFDGGCDDVRKRNASGRAYGSSPSSGSADVPSHTPALTGESLAKPRAWEGSVPAARFAFLHSKVLCGYFQDNRKT
mgnify:CR=1 FL=1